MVSEIQNQMSTYPADKIEVNHAYSNKSNLVLSIISPFNAFSYNHNGFYRIRVDRLHYHMTELSFLSKIAHPINPHDS